MDEKEKCHLLLSPRLLTVNRSASSARYPDRDKQGFTFQGSRAA